MVLVSQDDILRALKRFKGIAKQELLVNNPVTTTEFRKTHAESRREIYTELIELIEQSGVENACVFAFNKFTTLPEHNNDPQTNGHAQALEMFFNIIGIDEEQLKKIKLENLNSNQFLSLLSQSDNCYYSQT